MDGKLQTALNSGDAPDIFMARGGGKLADVVAAGQAMDITDVDRRRHQGRCRRKACSAPSRSTARSTACRRPCCPVASTTARTSSTRPASTETPDDDGRARRRRDKLKAAGIAPIAVGAKDAWPAAHWYYFFALRACSQDTLEHGRRVHGVRRPVLAGGRRGPRRTSSTPSRSTTGSSPPRRSRVLAARPDSSPTTRPPWNSWARGTPASSRR